MHGNRYIENTMVVVVAKGEKGIQAENGMVVVVDGERKRAGK